MTETPDPLAHLTALVDVLLADIQTATGAPAPTAVEIRAALEALAQERRRQGHRAMQARRIGYYHGRGR